MRSCTEGAFAPGATATLPFPAGGVCTEASWSWCTVPPAGFGTIERMRDAELSACCTAACSMSTCASRRRLRPEGVDGSGMAWSRYAAATSFSPAVFLFRRFVDVLIGQDALSGNARRRLGMCTTCGALLLERGAQLLGLPTLLIELGLQLFELRQLGLPRC